MINGLVIKLTKCYNDIRPDKIVVGFIGLSESINIAISWIKKCGNHIEAKKSKQPNLFTNFPGFNETIGFHSKIVYDESYIRKINNSTLDRIKSLFKFCSAFF